jgi:hypothetical protein
MAPTLATIEHTHIHKGSRGQLAAHYHPWKCSYIATARVGICACVVRIECCISKDMLWGLPGRIQRQLCSALPKSEMNTAALCISRTSCAKLSSVSRACISSSAGHARPRCCRTSFTTPSSSRTLRPLEAFSELAHSTRCELASRAATSRAPTFAHAMRRTASASEGFRLVVCERGSLTLSSASLGGWVGVRWHVGQR